MGYTHGTHWTVETIKEEVLKVKNALRLDRMPSKKECDLYFGNYALSNAVTKKIGWYVLAQELGLPMKSSDTQTGKEIEAKAAELLTSKGFEVQRMPQNFPYDLLVNGCVKVDVKASRLYRKQTVGFYSYNLEKPFATCDVYLLFALNDDYEIERTMIVPSKFVMRNTQIGIGQDNSKYHAFTDRWDYIRQMVDFWSSVKKPKGNETNGTD